MRIWVPRALFVLCMGSSAFAAVAVALSCRSSGFTMYAALAEAAVGDTAEEPIGFEPEQIDVEVFMGGVMYVTVYTTDGQAVALYPP